MKLNSTEKCYFLSSSVFWEIEWCQSFGNALNSETIPLIAWLIAEPQLACFLFWCGRHICVRLYHLGLLSRLAVCYFCFICTLSTQHRARIISTVFENRFRSVFQQNGALFDKWHQISPIHKGILCFLIWLPLIRDLSKKAHLVEMQIP